MPLWPGGWRELGLSMRGRTLLAGSGGLEQMVKIRLEALK